MHRKVFLCYSRKDRELFDAFRTHLAPFVQQGLLQVWSDEDIRATEGWDTRIRETIATADAAVLLVSPDLLASSYVTETEIPLLIQAAESGRLHLAPLFLRQSSSTIPQFDVVDAETGQRGIRITKYQGLNSPASPVAEQGRAEQDRVLAAAAEKLWNALEQLPDARERRRTLKGRELTIELWRREGGTLDRRYSKPRYGDMYQSRGILRLPQLSELEGQELGRQLFGALFGGDSEWQTILRMALGEAVSSPVRHSLRVRIVTDNPELRNLPWPLSQWQHYPLADAQQGWTFELSSNTQPAPVARLHMPCSAAMITAEPAGMTALSCEAHHAGLERLLGKVWNHPPRTPYMRKICTVPETEALVKDPPRLLYVYCHSRTSTDGLELILEDKNGQPVAVPFNHLAALLGSPPPQVIFLHTVGACSVAPPIPGVPLLLHLRRRNASWSARQEAQVWWEDVLGNGWDPVRAFHEIGPEARRHGSVQTDYEAWEANVSDYTPKIDRPRSRLDRTGQREAVLHAVRDLVNNTRRRVTCVIAYGAPGNLVHHFSAQSIHTLKDWAKDLARIHHHPLKFPDRRETLSPEQLEEYFRELMQIQPSQELEAGFRSERRGGAQAAPVHFLDWNTYGRGYLPPLRTAHLESWLTFCCDHLAQACTGRSRIVSYVAVVIGEPRHEEFRTRVERWRERPAFRQPHFDLLALPALGRVSANDLVRFLEDEDNTSCPREYLRDIPDRIIKKTGGDFEETVQLLENAERGMMWPELYDTLPKAPANLTQEEDILLE